MRVFWNVFNAVLTLVLLFAVLLFLTTVVFAAGEQRAAVTNPVPELPCLKPFDFRPECNGSGGMVKGLTAIFKPIEDFVNGLVSKDLDAAISDANAQVPVDAEAVKCWGDLKALVPPEIPDGAGVAYLYQKYRDVKRQASVVTVDCANVAPQIGVGMNLAIAAVGRLLP